MNARTVYLYYNAKHCTIGFKMINYLISQSGLDVSHSFSNLAKHANIFSPSPISSTNTSYVCLVAILSAWKVGYHLFQELSFMSPAWSPKWSISNLTVLFLYFTLFSFRISFLITSSFQFLKISIQIHRNFNKI